MALGFRLEQRQSLQLVMTPQLQQAIKLLQMSNLELQDFVEAEMESNPLIRVGESAAEPANQADAAPDAGPDTGPDIGPDTGETPLDARLTPEGDHSLGAETFDTGAENLYDIGPSDAGPNDSGLSDAGPNEPIPGEAAAWAGVGAGGNLSFDAPGFDPERQPEHPPSLRAHLLAQLGQSRAEPRVAALARLLVEELDEHGLLRADPAEIAARLGAAPEQVAAALALVRGCEPTGVGARDLAECLALQLAERDRLDPAMRRLIDNLDLVERGERRRLRALCGVDEEDFADMLAELRALEARPCAGFQAERAETLIPDVLLRRVPGGRWEIELNPETLPRVLVDNRYAARLAKGGREVRAFVSECRAGASWLKRSLDQRARTILAVATEIVRRQDGFFAEGIAGLKPLTLAMVAEATGLHESTVSRVTSNKYIATGRGVFELKFFFTNAIGPEGPAAAAVRHRIRAMIDAEAPAGSLSDDMIVERLQEDGIKIARRTVAKYRRLLGLPSSVGRRRLRAMMPEA